MTYLNPKELVEFHDTKGFSQESIDSSISGACSDLDTALSTSRYLRQTLEDSVETTRNGGEDKSQPIRELVAALAYGRLLTRNGYSGDRLKLRFPKYEEFVKKLDALSQGAAVLEGSDAIPKKHVDIPRLGKKNRISELSRLFSDSPMSNLWD